MSDAKKPAKAMPKGGRKGGSTFPRIGLEQAVAYARRLAAKTHSGPQQKDVVYSGVLDNNGAMGGVRLSALKQFGFSQGDSEKGFQASPAAKALAAAPPEELAEHLKAAVLRPRIFKSLFDTYHGDKVTHAKLKQRAAALEVHPELTQSCVDIYLESTQLAGLVASEGDLYRHVSDAEIKAAVKEPDTEDADFSEENDISEESERKNVEVPLEPIKEKDATARTPDADPNRPRAIFNVNVTLDSSLDIDKLQKHLDLLKKYGAI